jgi:transposase-like protein
MNKGKVWRHPEAFQRMAVERFKCCENIEHLAKELGVARQTLYRWHKKSECAGEGEDPVLAKSRESRLRREMRDLKRLLAEKVLEVISSEAPCSESRFDSATTEGLANWHLRPHPGGNVAARPSRN